MRIKAADIVTFAVIFVLVSGLTGLSMYKEDKDTQLPDNSFIIESGNGGQYRIDEYDGQFYAFLKLSNGADYYLAFRTDPRELDSISIDLEAIDIISSANKIYTSVNPEDTGGKVAVAVLELDRAISLLNPVKITEAFYKEAVPEDPNVPVKGCKDSNSDQVIIEFRIDSQESVYVEDKCVIVEGTSSNSLIKASTRLGYALVGIY